VELHEDGCALGEPTNARRTDWPRERLRERGASALSSVELLALLLRTGSRSRRVVEVAHSLWERFGSLERMAHAGDAELAAIAGLGPAKIASLRAAFELGARSVADPLRRGDHISSPERVVGHLGPRLSHLPYECFLTLLLDSRQRLLCEVEVSRGSLDQSLVHPREVFGPALREAAASLVLVHNHPSGDPEPSPEDRDVTCRLVRAGELLGIPVVDHVVVARHGYTSFTRRGWLQTQVSPAADR